MVDDLRMAVTAVSGSRPEAQQGIGTQIFNRGVELANTYYVVGDKKLALAAKAIYAVYVEIPGAAQATAASRGAADLDLHLTPGATSIGVQGTLDEPLLRRFLQLHRKELEGCFRRELVRNPDLEGTVSFAFQIDGAGGVRNFRAQPDRVALTGVGRCAAANAKGWKFPAGGDTLTVTYPVKFEVSR
jgi:hypothetical protein